jgi:hypothetical protein
MALVLVFAINFKNMKIYLNLLAIGILLVFSSCKKELLRDNLNDEKNPNGYKGALTFTKAELTDDQPFSGNTNSHNGQINVDEHLQFKVYVKNPGKKKIKGVHAVISASSNVENLGIIGGQISQYGVVKVTFGDIEPGQEVSSIETISFDVYAGGSVPGSKDNQNLSFEISTSDSEMDNTTSNFSFTVAHFTPSYNLTLVQPKLLSNDQWDGKIRGGATITIGLSVKNNANVSTGDIQGTITYNSSQIISVFPEDLDFGSISGNGSSKQETISVDVGGAAIGTNVPIQLELLDIYGNSWKQSFYFTING